MTIEKFLERLEEKGLSTEIFCNSLRFLASDDDEKKESGFNLCVEVVRSCLYFDLIDANEFVSLKDALSLIYFGIVQL